MKYWYLKGGDVLGPMAPEEIVKDGDFNTDALVCPEHESANQEAWRAPHDYIADFGPAMRAFLKDEKTAQAAALIEEISPEETIHSRSPLTASLEENLLDELPAAAVLPKAAPPPAPKPAQQATQSQAPKPPAQQPQPPKPVPAAQAPQTSQASQALTPAKSQVPEPPAETFSMSNAVVLKSGGEAPARRDKAEDSFFSKMEEESLSEAPQQQQESLPFDAEKIPAAAAKPRNEEVEKIFSKQTLTPDLALSSVKGKNLTPTHSGVPMPTGNGRIINYIDPPKYDTQPPKKGDKIFLLMVIMLIILAAVLLMAFFYKRAPSNPKPAAPAPAQQQEQPRREPSPAIQGVAEGIASPSMKVSQEQEAQAVRMPGLTQQAGNITVNAPDDATVKMMAQRLVKEYLLDERRGTVEEYFKRTYSGDYKTFWTANELIKNIYVVEFSAVKVRQEPIKYLFRMDVNKRELLGMNSPAMDLLSK